MSPASLGETVSDRCAGVLRQAEERFGWLDGQTGLLALFRMFSQDVFSVVDSCVILINLLLESNFIFMSCSVSSVKMASKRKSVTEIMGTKTPSYILYWCSWIAYCNCKRVRQGKTICFQLLGKKGKENWRFLYKNG